MVGLYLRLSLGFRDEKDSWLIVGFLWCAVFRSLRHFSGCSGSAESGTFANPQVEAGGIVAYGLHVRCTGTGFLPLSAKIRLQEEHLGFTYETVDETSKNLPEGGYGFVRGEAICDPTTSGHDYRIDGEIFAGKHHDIGISKEVHLPCNVH